MKNQQPDVEKIQSFVKDIFESKYQLLINKTKKVEIKHEKKSKAFIDYSQTVGDVCKKLRKL